MKKECLDDGSRYITVLNVRENGDILNSTTREISACIADGTIDLNDLPNIPDGTWTFTVPDVIQAGIINLSSAGIGNHVATYEIEANGCKVIASVDINIMASPDDPVISGPDVSCLGIPFDLVVNEPVAGTSYRWSADSKEFGTGGKINVSPSAKTIYSVIANNVFDCLSNEVIHTVEVKDIEVNFSVALEEINVDDRNQFSTDVEAVEYLWDFGDGLTSTEQNPAHIYFSEGTFDVTLSIVTADGCGFTKTKEGLIQVVDQKLITGIVDELKEPLVYPLPFSSSFTISLYSDKSQKVSVVLYTVGGKRVPIENNGFKVWEKLSENL